MNPPYLLRPRLVDDLGHPALLTAPPTRVVSLVPSITEAIATTVPESLVGATDWCTQPAGLDVTRVRGTKNPDIAAIIALRPELVVANQEENRRADVERLREAGIPVWVTHITSVNDALVALGRLFNDVLTLGHTPEWLTRARAVWAEPPTHRGLRVAVPVWRDPWNWVGSGTYAHDLLARLGCSNAIADLGPRYPRAHLLEVRSVRPDAILLPDEPYPFSADDGPDAFDGIAVRLVEGRSLFWYGPAMVEARGRLETALPR